MSQPVNNANNEAAPSGTNEPFTQSTSDPRNVSRVSSGHLARSQSGLNRSMSGFYEGGAPPVRRPSVLARLGIAVEAEHTLHPQSSKRGYDAANMPPRSPTGVTRRHSSLMRKRMAPKEKDVVVAEGAPVEEPVPEAAAAVNIEFPWHTATEKEVFAKLECDHNGLTTAEAQERLKQYGKNEITPPPQPSIIGRFFGNLLSPFSMMLMVGGTAAFVIVIIVSVQDNDIDKQTLALGCVLFFVAIVTSLFQTWMENASDNLMDALRALTAETAWVLRDGELREIKGNEIVPGDVVKVKAGEKVPADVRVLTSTDLKVNNATLTGENLDIKLGTEAKAEICFRAKNLAWSGCAFTNGSGTAIVFSTGDQTFFGKVAKAAVDAEKPDTLMRREVRRLIIIMSIIGVIVGFAFFGAALGTGRGGVAAVIVLVGLFTANIPEGLLPQITIALTVTARRMYRRHVVVSNLEIIETLGAVSVICSDKTGTLTTNKMVVSHMVYGGKIHMSKVAPVMPDDEVLPIDPSHPAAAALLLNAALNSDAVFVEKPSDDVATWIVRGDASEAALVRFVQEVKDLETSRKEQPRLAAVPFNSKQKWMASVNKRAKGEGQVVLMKGAAERILLRCDKVIADDGSTVNLDEQMKEDLNAAILNLARRGERVLAFAQLEVDFPEGYKFEAEGDDANFPLNKLVFIGMTSLVDPPRPTVPQAIADCHKAGIHVIMVTGDHPETALAISRSLGLISLPTLTEAGPDAKPEECAAVVTGEDMLNFSDEEWDRVLACKEHVFARTQPEQKQQLVWRLNGKGHIVAMTGDGVNDAPALKAANVGVAVGSGTQVAKEAAQIVITDDDFGSIVVGVREGRQIFDNLKKATTYILTHLCPETLPYVFNFAIGIPLAMETIVIILIDCGTDMLPGIALAYEVSEERVMAIPPRSSNDHLIQPRMFVQGYLWSGIQETFFCYWAFYYTFYHYGFTFSSTVGADTNYRKKWADLDGEYRQQYQGMCYGNTKWTGRCSSDQDMENFMSHMAHVVNSAQAAYFITLVVMQFANLLNRRNQTMSVFDPRQRFNYVMLGAIIASTVIAVLLVYIPGLNAAFYLDPVRSELACSALWGFIVMIGLEEIRKLIIRRRPDGLVARYTIY
jgi:sodium/potassium uptake antiporter P-type ATPase alpha subunit